MAEIHRAPLTDERILEEALSHEWTDRDISELVGVGSVVDKFTEIKVGEKNLNMLIADVFEHESLTTEEKSYRIKLLTQTINLKVLDILSDALVQTEPGAVLTEESVEKLLHEPALNQRIFSDMQLFIKQEVTQTNTPAAMQSKFSPDIDSMPT